MTAQNLLVELNVEELPPKALKKLGDAFATVLADIRKRDMRDMNRADSPLKPAEDAHLIDTSEMGIEAAFKAARAIIDAALK